MVFEKMEKVSRINTNTALYGVIGHPVAHSMGPLMHNHVFEECGVNGVYLAFDVIDLASAIAGVRSLNIRGLSVTIPHKVAIMEYLDAVDETAERIGAVNTVVQRDGILTGYNTDADGAVSALTAKMDLRNEDVLIVGAGGAARAVGFGVKHRGGRIHITNRTVEKGERLAAELNAEFHPLADIDRLTCRILINTTSVGMAPDIDDIPVPPAMLRPGMCVMDIVYNPVRTRLLKAAEAAGCEIVDGVSMFVNQAAIQFSLWTGKAAPVEAMRRIVYDASRHLSGAR